MTTESDVIDSTAVDVTPKPEATRALALADGNPYLAMASRAMELGKVDQLDRLLDLQMRWDAEQQRKAFVAAMSDFKAEAGGITIAKTKRVSFTTQKGKTEYDHAELHDITRALVPVMAKYGLSHRWTLDQSKGITVDCIVSHRDGHSEKVTMSGPADDSGGKNSIQAIASTKSYLERYTFLAATGVATGGELDDDARSYGQPPEEVQYITDAQLIVITDLVDAYVSNKPAFLEWASKATKQNLESFATLHAKNYGAVHAQLMTLKKKKEAAGA